VQSPTGEFSFFDGCLSPRHGSLIVSKPRKQAMLILIFLRRLKQIVFFRKFIYFTTASLANKITWAQR
jgi:hypothetical protein